MSYRGRFAPSPTGPLHAGSIVAALASWLDARAHGGAWLLRIEDIDPPREVPGASRSIRHTLEELGLISDSPVLFQHTRLDEYQRVIDELLKRGLAFECRCSRSDLASSNGIHRGDCRASDPRRAPAIRWRAPQRRVEFVDRIVGRYAQRLDLDVGDVVLRRADGLIAYQLAVVVDDAFQGITDVVRGDDLLDSTPRQIALAEDLGLPPMRYAHLPVVRGNDGQKLSKQNLAEGVDASAPLDALNAAAAHLGLPPGRDSIAATLASWVERWPNSPIWASSQNDQMADRT
jgi:glutamyl-Q tRNA(Asp) synthetase